MASLYQRSGARTGLSLPGQDTATPASSGSVPPFGGSYATAQSSAPSNPSPFDTAIARSTQPVAPPVQGPSVSAPTTPMAQALTPNFGYLTGYDKAKFDANTPDAKYQIGRTLSQFNPAEGVTSQVLTALNGLGYGTFSGSGQALGLSGLTDAGRQAGLSGNFDPTDYIQGFNSGTPLWKYVDPVAEAASAAADPFTTSATTSANPDWSWLTALLNGLSVVSPTVATSPAEPGGIAGPAAPAPAPPQLPTTPTSQPAPTFAGGYVTPGYGTGVGDATSTLSLALPQLLQNPAYANDPLVRAILQLQGGGA